jgi:CSLREA domain-containing protein
MAGSFIAGDGSQVPGNTPWKVLIGALQSGGGHIMDGKIDEVEFFNRALTSTEIAGIYNASSAGKCHTSTLQFSSASYNANENGNPPPITVTRTGAHDSAASVDYATTDGTATGNASCGAGVDYETSTGTLSFAAGEVSKTFSVPVCDDAVFEGDETLNLALSNQTGTGVTLGTPNTGVLTINDDEGQPSLSVNDFTFTGADSRAVDGFTVTLSGASAQTVTVHYATSDDTAHAGEDYTATSGTLTFAPGDTTKTIPVTILADNVNEPTETFSVDLDMPVNATVSDGHGVGTIPNDDPQPTISIDDVTFTGADSRVASGFTVTLSNPSSSTITVHYATSNDTAIAGEDYTAASGTLTFDPGDTSKSITVTILADNVNEPTETFNVDLDTPTNATILDGHGVGTIPNDDAQPTLSIDDVTHSEGDSGTTSYTFTVTKTGATSLTVTVDFATADGTATTANGDYQTNTGSLTFLPGDTTKTVTVLAVGNTIYETDETFNVNLSNATNASISDGQGQGTITNDDAKPTLSITSAVTLTEGNSGTKNFNFTVTKSGATDLDATVSYATADGTATGNASCGAGVDYASKSGTLTFHPADLTMTVTVPVCGDTVYEVNETFNVNLSSPTDATITNAQGTGTINNDDKPPTTLVVNTTDDLNSGFCFPAHCSLREAIVAANFNSDSNTITFQIPAGDPGHFYYADDNTAGQLSRANVTATSASDDTTISDIDPDWPHSWWTISPQSALPSTTATLTIDGYSQAGAVANTSAAGDNAVLRVEVNGTGAGLSVNGVAVGGSSSTLKGLIVNRFGGSGVSLSGGLHSVSGNFIGTDTSGTIALANVVAGVTTNGFSNQIGGTTPAARNLISGNTGDGISFASGNSYLVQGNLVGTKSDGTTALGNGANGITFSGGGAVFNTVGGVNTGEANTIAFNGGDGVYLDATAGGSNNVRGNSVYSNGTTSAHLGIDLGADGVTSNDLQDADTGPNSLQNFPVISSVTVTGSTKTITGTLNSKPNQEFTIDFYSNPSCDASGNGEGKTYIGSLLTGMTDANGDVSFTFHPSALSVGQSITATATDSGGNTSEFSQCVAVAGGIPGTIEFTSATYSVDENDGIAVITVKRTGGSQGSISATFDTSDGTATAGSDYTAVNSYTVTFADGDTTNKTINIPVTDNMVYEGNETVNLSLSSTSVNKVSGGANPLAAVLTITENDAPPTLSIDDVTFTGADSRVGQSFTVTLTGATDLPVTVHYATNDGTAHAGEDYTSATGTLTFNPGVTTQPIPVAIVADNRDEPTETFSVDLDTPVGATISDAQGVGTIPNDDAEPTLSVDDFTFTGADSRSVNGFTVNLSAPSSFTITVHYATSDGTAIAGEDYTAASGTLTFNPGDTTKIIPVTILGDTTNEPSEAFNVDLDTPTHATISDGHAVGTIPNDDAQPSMAIANATKVEGDSGSSNVTFTVTLSNPSTQTVSAQFTTTDGTASSGSDYSATTGTITFNPNQTSKTITVVVAGDIKDEANENFSVVLSNPSNASISTGTGVCTIIDDDLNTGDFDGDGKNDLAVFRPAADNTPNSKWYILNSADGTVVEKPFGTETDIPVAADYDGDGRKEIAVFRPSEGAWYIWRDASQDFVSVVWGLDGDKPVPGDYDGDGKADVAVFRPSDGYWYIRRSTDDQLQAQPWGLSTDKPVPADYDGDGKTDLAVFRKDDPAPGSGTWYILNTSDGTFSVAQWGFNTDKLVPADYDLDGKADIAIWRPSDGTFYVRNSSDGGLATAQWGLTGDVPVVGDYDGDGKADYAVFRPSSGHHFIKLSSDGTYIGPIWGAGTDVPVPSRYVPEQ